MRTVDIDWADLEIAFRDPDGESYLDQITGEVLSIVDGFDDERDLRERLARFPGRFLRIAPVDKAFSTKVLGDFIARQKGAARTKLQESFDGAGGYSRTTALLKEEKSQWAAFSRFEQSALLAHIEAFLDEHELHSADAAPSLELFEGLAG